MQRTEKAKEPSMEEILASIRKIISEEPDNRNAAPPRAPSAAKPGPEAQVAERTARVTPTARPPSRPLAALGNDDDLSDILDQPGPERADSQIRTQAPASSQHPTEAVRPATPAPAISREPLFQALRKANAEEAQAPLSPAQQDAVAPAAKVQAETALEPSAELDGVSLADRLRGLGDTRPGHPERATSGPEPKVPFGKGGSLAASVFGRRPAASPVPPPPIEAVEHSLEPLAEAKSPPAAPPAPATPPAYVSPIAAAPAPVVTPEVEAGVEDSAAPVATEEQPEAVAAALTSKAAVPGDAVPASAVPRAVDAALPVSVAVPVAPVPSPSPAPADAVGSLLTALAAPAPASAPVPVEVSAPAPAVVTGHDSAPVKPVRTLEDTVAELLRPMLREWLDANMPRIVEKALRVELAERKIAPKPADAAPKD